MTTLQDEWAHDKPIPAFIGDKNRCGCPTCINEPLLPWTLNEKDRQTCCGRFPWDGHAKTCAANEPTYADPRGALR